jgi:transposase
MHTSTLYYTTGISGYEVTSQKVVRTGRDGKRRERRVSNAARLVCAAMYHFEELGWLAERSVSFVLAMVALVDKATASLASGDKPEPARRKSRADGVEIVIAIRPKESADEKRKCRDCKGHDLVFRRGAVRRIRSLDFGRVRVYVEVEVRRVRCRTCGKTFDERLPFLTSPKARVTRAFEWEIVELRTRMSISEVAGWLDVSWRCVKEAERRVLEARYRRVDLKGVRMIGIDELCVFHREKSGRQYITVVRDMETGAILNVSRGKGGDALRMFAHRLRVQKAKVACVCMDMSNAYGKWAKTSLPGAVIVYDHFHVVKAMNDRLAKIRRAAMARISADVRRRVAALDVEAMARDAVLAAIAKERAREDRARETLKGNRKLLSMNKEVLAKDPEAKARLDGMLAENADLGKAYVMKEKLRDVYEIAPSEGVARVLFGDWIDEARESGVPELKSMADTLEEHLDGVLGFWRFKGASNAKSEGFNNKIRWLLRQAYGYRDYRYFRLKVFDLPNLRPRDSDC